MTALDNYSIPLNRENVIRIHFRMTQCQIGGGRLGKFVSFRNRLLKVWPELAPGEDETIAAAIPKDVTRNVLCTREEMSAVADGFMRLLNSDTILDAQGNTVPNSFGTKIDILKDAKIMTPELEGYLLKRLAKEPIEPFTPDIDAEDDEE